MGRKTLLSIVLLSGACSQRPKVIVGSKNFTEQLILGEIVAQHLERRLAIAVDRKLNLGGTMLAHQALVSGAIDLYPEYTGTAALAVLKQPATTNVQSTYLQKWKLRWLDPLGFNNTFAMAVKKEKAANTLSEAAASTWRLGAGYEFTSREDGLPGLARMYGLRFGAPPVTMDLGLLYSALTTNQVDMIAASSTDGMLSVLDVKVLRDDKKYFPPYDCALVVRDNLDPKVIAILRELSGTLDEKTMRRLNYSVDGEHKSPAEVAAAYLKTK